MAASTHSGTAGESSAGSLASTTHHRRKRSQERALKKREAEEQLRMAKEQMGMMSEAVDVKVSRCVCHTAVRSREMTSSCMIGHLQC